MTLPFLLFPWGKLFCYLDILCLLTYNSGYAFTVFFLERENS